MQLPESGTVFSILMPERILIACGPEQRSTQRILKRICIKIHNKKNIVKLFKTDLYD